MLLRTLPAALVVGVTAFAMPAGPPAVGPIESRPVPQDQQADTVKVIMSSGSGVLKVGVPDFTARTSTPELQQIARTLADVLWADLDFEREFYMIPRSESASIPVAATPEDLNRDRWSQLGADLVLMGSVQQGPKGLDVVAQFVGVKNSLKTSTFEYAGCAVANPRACAHFMADDIHKKTRGLDGVARSRLAFQSDRDASRMSGRPIPDSGSSKEIYISDYDGYNEQPVTANRSLNAWPAWAPDGRSLAYTSWLPGYIDIYVRNIFEPRQAQRPAGGGDGWQNAFPAWSPDGTKIAYASTRSGNSDIWVVNRDGSQPRNLTNHPGIDNAPTWSPTGTQIAFTSNRSGSNQIYTISVDGSGLQLITSGSAVDRPTWAPAPFNVIAFTCGSGPGHDICTISLVDKRVRVITDGNADNQGPHFSPNGRHITFTTSRWGKEQIAIIDPDGNRVRQITRTGNNSYPNWSRTPGR